jgi:hypothetical protein
VVVDWPRTVRPLYNRLGSNSKCNIFRRKCCKGNIYTQVSLEERTMIHTQLEMGLKPTAIAMGLIRAASTRSRELRRNGWTRPTTRLGPGRPLAAGGYRAVAAHARAQACTVTPHVAHLVKRGFIGGLNNKIRVIQRRTYGIGMRSTCGSRF